MSDTKAWDILWGVAVVASGAGVALGYGLLSVLRKFLP